jgi:hypothetical protein
MMYQGGIQEYNIGDKIVVRDRVKCRVGRDGEKEIVPEIRVSHNYCLRGVVLRKTGFKHDIQFEQDVSYLGIKEGDIIKNVPQVLFRRQFFFK